MVARNRARYLAPIALAAAVAATYLVVHGAIHTHSSPTVRTQVARSTTSRTAKPKPGGKFYTVKSGDTLSAISVKTGVALPTLEQLNPAVNPSGLQTGQRLRLRQ